MTTFTANDKDIPTVDPVEQWQADAVLALIEAEGVLAGKRLRAWQQGDETAGWMKPADPEPADDFFQAEEVQG